MTPPHAPTLAQLIRDGLTIYVAQFKAPMVPAVLDSLEVAHWLAHWLDELGVRVASPAASPPDLDAAIRARIEALTDEQVAAASFAATRALRDALDSDTEPEPLAINGLWCFAFRAALLKTLGVGAGSPQTPEPGAAPSKETE